MKLLKKLVIGGAPWEIYLTTAEETPEVLGKQGICVEADQLIYINGDETSEAGFPMVAAHEVAHASIFMCGGKETLKLLTGFKGTRYDSLEEFIVGSLFQSVYDTFTRNNWLRIKL